MQICICTHKNWKIRISKPVIPCTTEYYSIYTLYIYTALTIKYGLRPLPPPPPNPPEFCIFSAFLASLKFKMYIFYLELFGGFFLPVLAAKKKRTSSWCCTVIRFVWVSAKFGTCTVETLVTAKICTFTLESTHFIFNKCPIYTHDSASAKLALTHTKRFTVWLSTMTEEKIVKMASAGIFKTSK